MNKRMAKTANEFDNLATYVLGDEVVAAMTKARISRSRIIEAAALEAFTDNLQGQEIEQIRHELYFIRKHGLFFFAYLDNIDGTTR